MTKTPTQRVEDAIIQAMLFGAKDMTERQLVPAQLARTIAAELEAAQARQVGYEQEADRLTLAAIEANKRVEAAQRALAEERERCAVVAWRTGIDEHMKRKGLPHDCREIGSACAAAIRNAGEQATFNPEHSQECSGPASPAPDALVEEIALIANSMKFLNSRMVAKWAIHEYIRRKAK